MFMSTAVHFVEFIMMALSGMLMYKIYTSYNAWKISTAFFAPSDSINASNKTFDFSQKAVNAESIEVNKVTALDSKSIANLAAVSAPLVKVSVIENKSSAILNDYIGGFFSEPQVMDIEPYRAAESKKVMLTDKTLDQQLAPVLASGASELKVDDEIIKVTSRVAVPNKVEGVKAQKVFSVEGNKIPTLNEFSDLEPESFITVASINNDIKNSNKVMSDKVVMAMLDEAKHVCAS
tara:strand:+ start:907 stop:1611 length:705 start_codon:yes stop_codon:yes gene_type:complete